MWNFLKGAIVSPAAKQHNRFWVGGSGGVPR